MSEYAKLLEELETMAKSMSADDVAGDDVDGLADDEKIQASAADGNPDADGDGVNDVTGEGVDGDPDLEAEGADEPMGKSMTFTLDDGTEMEAIDGTELVKSLMARVETTESEMAKAMTAAVDLLGKQGTMIKSLQAEVAALAGQGRGRKTVVSIAEKPTLAKSAGADNASGGMSPQEVMAKALTAQAQGKLSGLDVARCEAYLNKGMAIPTEILNRIQ